MDELWVVSQGKVVPFHGNFQDHKKILQSSLNQDVDGSVSFFWGSDSEGNLVLSDDAEVVKKGCGKSFAPFSKGCFFTSSKGLRSYEHPPNEVKPVPRVDSSGQVCGATFKVDAETKKESSMPRVGSAANWSSHY
ncbi:uncharacterized protein LOC115667865 isoform X2 [Syzygium oleosum]|nr:uncharacterized protein LOC115667865 isoform X2 [Syzygium oleosum]